ncbi:MAG: hypothetical protein EBS08_07085, partial [Cytophagia bacterium]|nr:hypothetical protein [Cytophagia bacterium]
HNGRHSGQTHHKTLEEVQAEAERLVEKGRDVYFSCGKFVTDENREADNCGWMKSFFLDIDCGESKAKPDKHGRIQGYVDQATGMQAIKDFAAKAREKKLQPQDWEGNTFTISNLGMFGIEAFTAIINPPDACIMAVGAVRECPVVRNGQLGIGQRMTVTLSCDHRVVDGATGAAFLQSFALMLRDPVSMLL